MGLLIDPLQALRGSQKTFGSADQVKPHTVFNISGNKYRLIAVVDYTLQFVPIEHVLTHSEYDEKRWRK